MKTVSTLLAVTVISGCAVLYEGKYDYDEGWRVATVLKVVAGPTEMLHVSLDCRKGSAIPSSYLYVRYLRSFAPRHAIVPIVESGDWHNGQQLYLNIRDCRVTPRADMKSESLKKP